MPNEIELFGKDLFGDSIKQDSRGLLGDKFLIPPFSTLNAREGWWQERKSAWKSLGLKGEVGREEGLTFNTKDSGIVGPEENTSIFDPVLCELAYRWFCPGKGTIVDPFAGGSVRGIVAHFLGYKYWGCDLRNEQIEENRKQANEILSEPYPQWVCLDSEKMALFAPSCDFIFSCPPYGNLEKYSDHPDDLSNMSYASFMQKYFHIIQRCFGCLKNNRFACFVVGDYRDKNGNLVNFPGTTAQLFIDAGFTLYNEAILMTSIGTASARVTNQFECSRKFAKVHQNVLVFLKGDARIATASIKDNSSFDDLGKAGIIDSRPYRK